jgi:hypothetical protein
LSSKAGIGRSYGELLGRGEDVRVCGRKLILTPVVRLDFFTACAQVAPIVLIGLLFQMRNESQYWDDHPKGSFALVALGVGALLVAEFFALGVLGASVEQPPPGSTLRADTYVVWWSLLIGVGIGMYYILVSRLHRWAGNDSAFYAFLGVSLWIVAWGIVRHILSF